MKRLFWVQLGGFYSLLTIHKLFLSPSSRANALGWAFNQVVCYDSVGCAFIKSLLEALKALGMTPVQCWLMFQWVL